jgi:outer membrane lipoprotein-sorting protein
MKKFFASLLLPGILLPSFCTYGAENSALIVDKLAGANGFTMTFEQTSKYKFLNKPKVSKGKLIFVPPKNFVWEIEGENAGKVISNGKKTWIYSPAEEAEDTPTVVIKKGVYEGVQSIIFDPQYKDSSLVKEGDVRVLKVQGNRSKGYMWAEVEFLDSPDFRIDRVVFEDIEGTKVIIKANSFDRLSTRSEASIFSFKAPKGARIITK